MTEDRTVKVESQPTATTDTASTENETTEATATGAPAPLGSPATVEEAASEQADTVEVVSDDASSELAGKDTGKKAEAGSSETKLDIEGLKENLALYRLGTRLGSRTIAKAAEADDKTVEVDADNREDAASPAPTLEVEKHVSTKRGELYTVQFDKPMTEKEAREFLFHDGNVPTTWGARERDNIEGYLVPVPRDAEKATRWQFLDPKNGISHKDSGLTNGAREALHNGRTRETSRIPDHVGPKTRGAIERGEYPPKPGSGLDVQKRGDAYVWEEGNTLFWYKKGSGVRGARLHPTNETYNKDMRQYVLGEGQDPYKAEDRFASEWDKIVIHTMGAYGVSLGAVGGTDAAGDLNKAIRYSNRQTR